MRDSRGDDGVFPIRSEESRGAPSLTVHRNYGYVTPILRVSILGLLMLISTMIVLPARAIPTAEMAVSYAPNGAPEDERSYDFFPPLRPGGAFVVFVQSRFWSERQPAKQVISGFVKGAVQAGHAVAVIRHRTTLGVVHPGPIRDIALGFAAVVARAKRAGLDLDRIFLVGHSSGAQLAMLLALDPSWLQDIGAPATRLAGVVSLSGILDLKKEGAGSPDELAYLLKAFPKPADRMDASPASHLDRARPAMLVMTASRDIPGYGRAAAKFVEAARAQGTGRVERFVATGRDHFSILDLTRGAPSSRVLEFFASDPLSGNFPEHWQVVETWRNPPFSTLPFFSRYAELIKEYEADASFTEVINRPFRPGAGDAPRLRVRRYSAIDLLDLLEAMGELRMGNGNWLELTNIRGEKAFFPMARMRALRPRIVIGVDGDHNLFRATDLYHTKRRYSWLEAEARDVNMARPLGAFVYFPGEEPTAAESLPLFGRYALTVDSFRLHDEDPRAPLADIPAVPRIALLETYQCVSCHRVRDVGGQAFHLRARDGAVVGGHALPLERYPAVVWKRFVFEQRAVAAEVGANAVPFSPAEAKAIYDFIVEERSRRGIEPWNRPDQERAFSAPR